MIFIQGCKWVVFCRVIKWDPKFCLGYISNKKCNKCMGDFFWGVADLSPKKHVPETIRRHRWYQKGSKLLVETRVWRLDSPKSTTLSFQLFFETKLVNSLMGIKGVFLMCPATQKSSFLSTFFFWKNWV